MDIHFLAHKPGNLLIQVPQWSCKLFQGRACLLLPILFPKWKSIFSALQAPLIRPPRHNLILPKDIPGQCSQSNLIYLRIVCMSPFCISEHRSRSLYKKSRSMAALHFPFSWAHLAIKANTTDSLIDLSPVGEFLNMNCS